MLAKPNASLAESLLECKATSTVSQSSIVALYFLNANFKPPVVFGCNQILPLVFVEGCGELIATSTPSSVVVVESVAIFIHEPFATFLKSLFLVFAAV